MARPRATKPGHWSVSQVARVLGISRSRVVQLDDVLTPVIEQSGAYKARWYSLEVVRAYASSRRTSPIDERVNYRVLQSLRALVVDDDTPVRKPVREHRPQQASERAIQDFLRCVDLGIRQSDDDVGRPVAGRWRRGQASPNPRGRPRGS